MKIKINIKTVVDLDNLNNYLLNNGIKLVLFGETHGFINELDAQRKIIQSIKCDLILYELLENKRLISSSEIRQFLSYEDEKDFSIVSKYGDLKKVLTLAKEFNVPIIGCDLKNLGRHNKDFISRKVWSKEELQEEDMLMTKREKRQYSIIKKYLNKYNMIFASIGLYHLRPFSLLIQSLNNTNFVIIYPCLKSGKPFGEEMNFDKEEIYFEITTKDIFLKNKCGQNNG